MDSEKNKTVGQQILDNWGKSESPECREVTNESWWKSFHPKLKDLVEKHKSEKDKFYIMLNVKNEGLMGWNAKHATWIVADEELPPKSMAILWSYVQSTGELRIEWCLPDEVSIEEICAMPETYDKKLVADCKNYMAAKKIAVDISKVPRPKTKQIILP